MLILEPRPLVAGNWKMNGLRAGQETLAEIGKGYDAALRRAVDLLVCPPATLLHGFSMAALGTRVAIGGQDCHTQESGAFTGDISAEMVADTGATFVILGHSERRQYASETDALVADKTRAAWRAGLVAIVCIGETREEREAGRTLATVRRQLRRSVPEGATPANLVVAYEPVWAIGTGLTPQPADVAEVHGLIRDDLKRIVGRNAASAVRILYGGSVKPSNAKELMSVENVDGALVGGASLKADGFLGIARAFIRD